MGSSDEAKFLTAQEAAQALRCSVATIRSYVKTGQLNPVRLGSRYRFSELDVQTLLETGTDERYKEFMAAKAAKDRARAEAKEAAGTAAEPHMTLRVRRTLACLWRHHGRLAEAAEAHQKAVTDSGRAPTRAELVQGLADALKGSMDGVDGLDHVNWRSLAFAWLEDAEEGGRDE